MRKKGAGATHEDTGMAKGERVPKEGSGDDKGEVHRATKEESEHDKRGNGSDTGRCRNGKRRENGKTTYHSAM
ncbi:hypothetical protein EDM53_03650 [Rickettsiales endosymbiont of Peranema trichophorum]|uniref:hypothetical protein n=1 Tax=Rickettsiales endosymbiont of Peranema trichophorum TaxID=2486577 RepID=UPI00102373F8|nr:hypothetical protein [Rickettsiales endosymbiont of Peranema trichophorum]RZI46768.1 hypothetical protein EDM53_03650 [Rickettsiales endosymbiont of Peranema trichophorum]